MGKNLAKFYASHLDPMRGACERVEGGFIMHGYMKHVGIMSRSTLCHSATILFSSSSSCDEPLSVKTIQL